MAENRFPAACDTSPPFSAVRLFRYPAWRIGIFFILLLIAGKADADPGGLYGYRIKPGDTLGAVACKFSCTPDWRAVARASGIADPDRIYPGQTVRIAPTRPEAALRQYLKAIYARDLKNAFGRLTHDSRERLPYEAFEAALQSATRFDLNAIRLCSDFYLDGRHIAQVAVNLEEDPARWGFNLAWEENEWRVLLYDAYPAFPHYDGIIAWQCESDN